VNRADFQLLADLRLEEAKVLHAASKYSGAYYIAGYSVEFALKACIAKTMKAEEWPDPKIVDKMWTHNLVELRGLAGLAQRMEEDMKTDRGLFGCWGAVKAWTENERYDRNTTSVDSAGLIEAIENPQSGVLSWIKRQPQW